MITYEVTYCDDDIIEIAYYLYERRYCTHFVERSDGGGYEVFVLEKDVQDGEEMIGLNYLGKADTITDIVDYYSTIYPIKGDGFTPPLP